MLYRVCRIALIIHTLVFYSMGWIRLEISYQSSSCVRNTTGLGTRSRTIPRMTRAAKTLKWAPCLISSSCEIDFFFLSLVSSHFNQGMIFFFLFKNSMLSSCCSSCDPSSKVAPWRSLVYDLNHVYMPYVLGLRSLFCQILQDD